MHWSIAIPFLGCYLTALVLIFVFHSDPSHEHRSIVSWAHRISGLCLLTFPLLTLARSRQEFRHHLANIREAWIWRWSDIKWLLLSGAAALSKRVELPEQGKFNAAEKLNFMTIMATYPVFIVTGILIWMPGIAFVSWIVHFSLAVLVTPLMIGHIFMATVNPSTRVGLSGMTTGFVDRTWARHHYGRWFREQVPPAPTRPPAVPRAATSAPATGRRPVPVADERPGSDSAPPLAAAVRCSSCRREQVLVAERGDLRALIEADPFTCDHCGTRLGVVTVIADPGRLGALLRQLDSVLDAEPAARA